MASWPQLLKKATTKNSDIATSVLRLRFISRVRDSDVIAGARIISDVKITPVRI